MRWKRPPRRTSCGAPPNAAPNSTQVPAMPTADPVQYAAQPYSHRRAAEPAQTKAAAGIPMKIGIAHRLCSCPPRVSPTSGAAPRRRPEHARMAGGQPQDRLRTAQSRSTPRPPPRSAPERRQVQWLASSSVQDRGPRCSKARLQHEVRTLRPALEAVRQRTHRATSPVIACLLDSKRREHAHEHRTRRNAATGLHAHALVTCNDLRCPRPELGGRYRAMRTLHHNICASRCPTM